MLKRMLLAIGVCLLLPVMAIHAQTPQLIDSALADLSQRVGRTITLNDLDNWTFSQSNYPDASLGCPQPGQVYAQIITPGVQFIITYAGNIYDYRVSGDRTAVILCGIAAAPSATVSAACPPPDDAAYLPPRLQVGGLARVTEGGIPNLMRSGPGQSGSVVGEIPPGGEFSVLDGPRCSTLDKLIWWNVNYNGVIGWTAEGRAGDYWLEPVGAVPTNAAPPPAAAPRITVDNAAQLGRISNLDGLTGPAAMSPDGAIVVMGLASGSLGIFDTANGAKVLEVGGTHPGGISALAFGADGRLLATAGQDGSITIWDIGRYGTFAARSLTQAWGMGDRQAIAQRVRLGGASDAISALAFSQDGLLLAAGGAEGVVRLWNTGARAADGVTLPLVTFPAQSAAVTELLFSSSGLRLFSSGTDGSAYLWGLPN